MAETQDLAQVQQYIASLLNGALSILPVPDPKALAAMTQRVFSISAGSADSVAQKHGYCLSCR